MKRETKGRKEIIAYVAEATGVAPRDVGKVIDATFAFVRDAARGGSDVAHPSLGRIRVKRKDEAGEVKTSYRYQPEAEVKAKRAKPAEGTPDAG